MVKTRISILFGVIALTVLTACPSMLKRAPTASRETSAAESLRPLTKAVIAKRSRVCSILEGFPKPSGQKLAFEKGQIGGLCQPFVRGTRATLDKCGEPGTDPYTLVANDHPTHEHSTQKHQTQSRGTWPSRNQMYSKGRINLLADPVHQEQLPGLYKRIETIRNQAAQTCCGDDIQCQTAMTRVDVSICQPKDDPNASDPCVFGGTFEMAGRNYAQIFGGLTRIYRSNDTNASDDTRELGRIASKNLGSVNTDRILASLAPDEFTPLGGRIILTSYVPKNEGARALEPTLHHEFGHACSMIRMQTAAAKGTTVEKRTKALRALKWLDTVKHRCDLDAELPEAYFDFWETLGESRELASCMVKLTELNRRGEIDRPCAGLCPGHYLEEAVGVAFSMLNGDVSGLAESVYPNTCDHMRDRQHPMVADVVECLAQHSPRFRSRVATAYGCSVNVASGS